MGYYSVRPPYQAYGASVGRESRMKREDKFSTKMRELGGVISDKRATRQERRFSEQMQEDAQAHAFDLARSRLQNEKDLAGYRISVQIAEEERKEREAAEKSKKVSETLQEYFKKEGMTADDSIWNNPSRIVAETGLPLGDILPHLEANNAAAKAAQEYENRELDKEGKQLGKTKVMLELDAKRLELAKLRAEQEALSFSERAGLKVTKEKAEADKAIAEAEKAVYVLEKAKIEANSATRRAKLDIASKELDNRGKRLSQTLTEANIEKGKADKITSRQDRVFNLAQDRMAVYYKDLEKYEAALPNIPDGPARVRVLDEIGVKLAGYNRQARKINNPQLKFDKDTNMVVVDTAATSAEYDFESRLADMVERVKDPEKIVSGLLEKLPLKDADSKFLTIFNTVMDAAGKDFGDIARGLEYYDTYGEQILANRRRQEAANNPRIPRTTEDVEAPPPPPPTQGQGELDFLSY